MKTLEQLQVAYFESLNSQGLKVEEEDYLKFDKHKEYLEHFAQLRNSRICVYDIHKLDYIFYNNQLKDVLGEAPSDTSLNDADYIMSRIHPDDLKYILEVSIKIQEFSKKVAAERKKDFQLHAEFRILNKDNEYIRVIEQYQNIELDREGNIWLILNMMDISPNQSKDTEIVHQLIDTKTNKLINFEPEDLTADSKLSKREKEVFGFVKKGYLSKEISDTLSISVHTVNTHRQNILKKLNVSSFIEAIDLGKEY